MDNEKVLLTLNDHKNEIGSLKHRVSDLEEGQKSINTLTLAVNKLAINMENMVELQKQQGARLESLEKAPAEEAKYLRRTIITSVVTAVVGAIIGALIGLIF